MRILLVDGANVVGSRPDGWWRDRAGAASRLWERLVAADLAYDEVVLVLEGAARAGVPTSAYPDPGAVVRVVHARQSGDDAIVEESRVSSGAGHEVTVVSADRTLRRRVSAYADVVGPRWLLDRI